MAAKETPLQTVKRLHGSKEKLVETLVADLESAGEDADDLETRLQASTNKKLLRLAAVTAAIKSDYGNRDGLVKAIAEAGGKGKDQDYIAKLGTLPLPRLLDMARSARRRAA
jgi:hypothetical protein